MDYTAQEILNIKTTLGECPVWSELEQKLYFVDIIKPAIYRFDPVNEDLVTFSMPEDTGCIGLRENGGFIAALRSGVYLLDKNAVIEKKIADNPSGSLKSRFNDGCVDPWGNFWCGTIWQTEEGKNAQIIRVTDDYMSETIIRGLTNSNGIAFSPDNEWMYYTDTPTRKLCRTALDKQTGEVKDKRSDFVYEFDKGSPDGAVFDSDGNYWSALFGEGKVISLSPEGNIIHTVYLPVKQVTMACFGGKELDTLYITTSREHMTDSELEEYPQSGNVFAVKVKAKGLSEPLYKG